MARDKKLGKERLFALELEGEQHCTGSERDCYKAKKNLGLKNAIVVKLEGGNNHKSKNRKQSSFDINSFTI